MKKLSVVLATMTLVGALTSAGPAQAAGPAAGVVAAAPADSTAYGRTVDAATGRGVPFVLVVVYEEDYSTLVGATVSGPRGWFRIRVPDEEFALRYIGRLTRHETGWQACDRSVVPTTGEACTQAPGAQGRILLDRR